MRRRALAAACIGNLIEWYDFALYGALTPVIAATFFPGPDPIGGLVATFGVFGVAFVSRPVGALVFGHYGDRVGRQRALVVSILLMAVVTTGIGLTPGFASIGWLAPALLTVLRLAQGVAVGGEYGGSAALVVEYAPDDLRGWYGGWQWASVTVGIAAGLGAVVVISANLPAAAVDAWAWRLPFLLALPLGVVGLYIRSRLEDTPAFQATQRMGAVADLPIAEAVRNHRRQALVGFGVVAAVVATFNVFFVFLPGYLATQGVLSLRDALSAGAVSLALGSAAAPVFGRVSDRIGRRPVLIGGVLVLLAVMTPAASLIAGGGDRRVLLGYLLIGVPLGALALTAFLAELFPTRLRYSGLSLTYGLGSALFAGTTPLVATMLVRYTGDLRAVLWYATILTVVGAVCTLLAPETADVPIDAD